jgi:hypothetical protein
MENYPDGKASIQIRERIVLPLLIQQYALLRINEIKMHAPDENLIKVYEKIVMRSLLETQTQVETQHKHTKNEIKPITSYRIRSLIRSLYSAFRGRKFNRRVRNISSILSNLFKIFPWTNLITATQRKMDY